VGTALCQHARWAFGGRPLNIQYADGAEEFVAPQVMAIAPDHDGWVLSNSPKPS
jgi:hypothetical protein